MYPFVVSGRQNEFMGVGKNRTKRPSCARGVQMVGENSDNSEPYKKGVSLLLTYPKMRRMRIHKKGGWTLKVQELKKVGLIMQKTFQKGAFLKCFLYLCIRKSETIQQWQT